MNPIPDSPPHSSPVPAQASKSFWRKLGGGSLSISLILHVVLLAIGVIWVFQIVTPVEKKVEFTPNSGGGGSAASEIAVKQRVQMMQANLSRVVAIGAEGTPLSEPENLTQMTSLGAISSDPLSGGKGGGGNGGGKGDGNGPGFGDSLAPGMSTGNGTKNPFGMVNPDKAALVGTFYDLKQSSGREPTNLTDDGMRAELREITRRGLKEKAFEKFFKAPRELYQTKFMIPRMSADLAPSAFEVEEYVQPKRWVVIYRGAVVAPKSGRFRFVGACDDVLVVKFNNRLVFDHGYTLACTTASPGVASEENYNKDRSSDQIKDFRKHSPMPVPTMHYKYSTTPRINADILGVAVGPEFQVTAGKTYPIDILISEIPGGLFSAALLIQEEGVTYPKDPAGYPILPLFRLDQSLPDPGLKGEAPPFDPNGPVWKGVEGGPETDI